LHPVDAYSPLFALFSLHSLYIRSRFYVLARSSLEETGFARDSDNRLIIEDDQQRWQEDRDAQSRIKHDRGQLTRFTD